jgi:hypothetical protein
MRVIMSAIIDQAGRPFNADQADAISRRHRCPSEPGPTTLTNGRTRSSEYRDGLNGRHTRRIDRPVYTKT